MHLPRFLGLSGCVDFLRCRTTTTAMTTRIIKPTQAPITYKTISTVLAVSEFSCFLASNDTDLEVVKSSRLTSEIEKNMKILN